MKKRKSKDFEKSVKKNSMPKSTTMHRIAVTLAIFIGIVLGLVTLEDNTSKGVKIFLEVYPKFLKIEIEILRILMEAVKKNIRKLKALIKSIKAEQEISLEHMPCKKRYVISLLGYMKNIPDNVPEEEKLKQISRSVLRFCPKELKKLNRIFKRLQINNENINKSKLKIAEMQVLAVIRRASVVLRHIK